MFGRLVVFSAVWALCACSATRPVDQVSVPDPVLVEPVTPEPATKTEVAAAEPAPVVRKTEEPEKPAPVRTRKPEELPATAQVTGETPAQAPDRFEVRAKHILVASREEAEAIIASLETGADFETLAREKSTDPSVRDNGGELGFFRRGMMVKPFEEAAFALQVGRFSRTPVKTDYGWHVILLEEAR